MTDRADGEHRWAATVCDDAGVTLIEVMVSATLVAVVTAMFTTGLLDIYRSTLRTEAASSAQSQLSTAFLRLDRQVRYAAQVTVPGPGPAGQSRVEFLTTHTGAAVCTQLQVVAGTNGGRLQSRTWNYVPDRAPGPLPGVTPFITLASELTAATPFPSPGPTTSAAAAAAAAASEGYQRLRVRLTARQGSGSPVTADITFTALNSLAEQPEPQVCLEGRTIP